MRLAYVQPIRVFFAILLDPLHVAAREEDDDRIHLSAQVLTDVSTWALASVPHASSSTQCLPSTSRGGKNMGSWCWFSPSVWKASARQVYSPRSFMGDR